MHALLDLLHQLTSYDDLMRWSGPFIYVACTIVIFVETGLFCFFLPGDSLLVTAGLVAGSGHVSIALLNVLLIAAAIAGDTLSYWIGWYSGPALFKRPRSLFFRPDYLVKAHEFYERNGPKTIVIARFVPVIRTFAPVVAGVGRMGYGRFVSYNVFGGVGWVASLTLLGYFLGSVEVVKKHVEVMILTVVFLSILPGVIEVARARLRARAGVPASEPAPPAPKSLDAA